MGVTGFDNGLLGLTLTCLVASLVVEGKVFHGCCWGNETVAHGHTALTLPHCCTNLVCHNGLMETKHIGDQGAVNCCEFNGLLYPDGSHLAAHCVSLLCSHGYWTLGKVEDCCAHCSVFENFYSTWDGHHYDFHGGSCNYSMAQTDSSLTPHTAVYVQVMPCYSHHTCLQFVTFRDNPHTVITLRLIGPNILDVNGEPFTLDSEGVHIVTTSSGPHPVLAWRHDHCISLLGASRIMVVLCDQQLGVWAFPTHAGSLDGLCGHFNFNPDDDLASRSGHVTPLTNWPRAFPQSWRTNDYDSSCLEDCDQCPPETTDPCQASSLEQQHFLATCRNALYPVIGTDHHYFAHHVDSCAFDFCQLMQTGASGDEIKQWIIRIKVVLHHAKQNLARIEDNLTPTSPPSHGVCSPGSSFKIACNWCTCNGDGNLIICTQIACDPDYVPELGEAVCEDGSWWRADDCNWCQCVRGGFICTHDDCGGVTTTTGTATPAPPVCLLPVAPGHCYQRQVRFYYNSGTGQCQVFLYTGCGTNGNNFQSFEECVAVCGSTIITSSSTGSSTTLDPAHCHLQQDSGPCGQLLLRYYFDSSSGQCFKFVYGGCDGNGNNFHTLAECVRVCGATGTTQLTTSSPGTTTPGSPQEGCLEPTTPGPCTNYTLRYTYNQETSRCETFVYGGCEPNPNNFKSLQLCNAACGNLVTVAPLNPCQAPSDPGPCTHFTIRYAYDPYSTKCNIFYYGGCEGNGNNFPSMQECEEACAAHSATEVTTGYTVPPTTGFTTAPIYGPDENQTAPSYVNALPSICYLEADPGPCSSFAPIFLFYFDKHTGTCKTFSYGGCEGNGNKFSSLMECNYVCGIYKY